MQLLIELFQNPDYTILRAYRLFYNRNFNLYGTAFKIQFHPRPEAAEISEKITWLFRTFGTLLEDMLSNVSENDFVAICIDSPALKKGAIYMPFVRRYELTLEFSLPNWQNYCKVRMNFALTTG